jgi:hypothetical protein
MNINHLMNWLYREEFSCPCFAIKTSQRVWLLLFFCPQCWQTGSRMILHSIHSHRTVVFSGASGAFLKNLHAMFGKTIGGGICDRHSAFTAYGRRFYILQIGQS